MNIYYNGYSILPKKKIFYNNVLTGGFTNNVVASSQAIKLLKQKKMRYYVAYDETAAIAPYNVA